MWRSVELREIRLFLVLADELHFGRTAERCRVTQSRVSQSLRELERKLGVDLVRRTSRRVELTSAGERFRDDAGAALATLERALDATERSGRSVREPVRLGVMAAAVVGPEVRAIIEAHERTNLDSPVELVGLPFRDRFGPLRRGEIDVMVASLPVDLPGIVTGRVLSRHPRMLAVGRTHPLAARPTVSVEDLADHAVAELDLVAPRGLVESMVPTTTPTGRPIPRVPLRADEASTLILAVASGKVVHPVTSAFAATYAHPDVTYVRIHDLPPSRSVLAWRTRDRHRGLRAFLRAAEEVAARAG
jgi:DNA-binding transcriptional LysR family regulator